MEAVTKRLSRHQLARLGQRAGLQRIQDRADAVGISRSHLNKVECGAMKPSLEMVDRMSAAYHVSVEQIERASRLAIRTLMQLKLDQADDVA